MAVNNKIPGVYSQVDASAAVSSTGGGDNVIGIVSQATTGDINVAFAPLSYDDAVTKYGLDSTVVKLMSYAMRNGGSKFIVVRAAGIRESASLKITAGATTSGNVTVTLDGVNKTVAVAAGDTAIQVADKIRATEFDGWTAGGTAGTDTVTFLANDAGDRTDSAFTPGTTGVTGTVTTVLQGSDTVDYQSALDVLELEEAVKIVITDSVDSNVHTMVKNHVSAASENRKERTAVLGLDKGTDVNSAVAKGTATNSGRIMIQYPNPLDIDGAELSGIYGAAALAGALANEQDPSMPMTGVELFGFYGLSKKLKDSEMEALIDAGISPLQTRNGSIRIVRLISTYTKNGSGVDDITWQEVTTTRISDFIFNDLRNDLTLKFSRAKQNQQTREAIKTQVLIKLRTYQTLGYIENVTNNDVSIQINPLVPTRSDVVFKYDVVTPLNVISLTGHLVI